MQNVCVFAAQYGARMREQPAPVIKRKSCNIWPSRYIILTIVFRSICINCNCFITMLNELSDYKQTRLDLFN